jgi:hypothetical protein
MTKSTKSGATRRPPPWDDGKHQYGKQAHRTPPPVHRPTAIEKRFAATVKKHLDAKPGR